MDEPHNNRMQPDFGKLRMPQPLMRGVRVIIMHRATMLLFICFSLDALAGDVFQEKHLGYKFALGNNIVYAHNPHSMRKTKIFHAGKHCGGFTISILPSDQTKEEFIAYGKGYYHRKYDGATVDIRKRVNSNNLDYDEISASFSVSGVDFIEKRSVFIQERDGVPGEEKIPMMYTFNFLYPASTSEVIINSIYQMVDTFELIPNDGIYNYAIKNAVGQ